MDMLDAARGAPFDGYRRRLVPPPDPELTPVGPGTSGGEYLRRFWQPVAFARELVETPLRVRILGEDLVVFRDRGGRTGLLHLHCAHRGTSLEYGIPVERGLRCRYHGWVFDVDGRCLDTPGEPRGSRLRERVWQGAYPTLELAGLIFAYLGPPDRRPAFPRYDSYDVPGHRLMPAAKFTLPCHWLQVKDNSMDPVHTAFLHALSSGYQFTEAFGAVTNFELAQVDPAWGLGEADVARPGFGQSDDRPYAERQRHPADFDAQSSQRTITVHALEHLGSADRGVVMLRRIVRDGIRAVASGKDPWGTAVEDGRTIRTFTQDVVFRIPPAADPAADRALLRATGRKVVGDA